MKSESQNLFFVQNFNSWFEKKNTFESQHQAEQLAIRRDMVTLLKYIQATKVVGTKSTGNMPLKAIREVTNSFVEPPLLDHVIGDKIYKLKSEYDVWPLYFLHILGEVGNLLKAKPGKQWRLTTSGKRFLTNPPLVQVAYMLSTWWHSTNWAVAFPVEGIGESIPHSFNLQTLYHLQKSDAMGHPISFEHFSDGLIDLTGIVWGTGQSPSSRMLLHGAFRRIIISILKDFNCVTCEYRDEPLGNSTIKQLESFELTSLGRILIQLMHITSND